MRFSAPRREAVEPAVFRQPPLACWYRDYAPWLAGPDWPSAAALSQALAPAEGLRFVCQDPALLADGRHYEERIALDGAIATRAQNWHDLFNALIWLRYPMLKRALNRQQMLEIAQQGPRQRSRVQCALTHFDEAGVMVQLRDPQLLAAWDQHDWPTLFQAQRAAWTDGRIEVQVFGHALLEHALVPRALLVGKALVSYAPPGSPAPPLAVSLAEAIAAGQLLRDPQELRPLPLSGIPGWHPGQADPAFYQQAACFRPRRAGRSYPSPHQVLAAVDIR